jgi:hypothetical protein
MKKLIVQVIAIVATIGTMSSCSQSTTSQNTNILPESITLTKEVLMDKVKGGWAGQTIGVVYGGPTEFVFRSAMIPDHYPIKAKYRDGKAKWYLERESTLFDDIYMDLTFVEVYERLGMDAPVDSFAKAFAYAGYDLWHANEAARYNILNGIMPPESGYWKNNPHADDIDYQIEADFAGLMTPGMPNTQSDISDKIGHIMNYGDGWYGGVYVGAMYSLAYVSDNINFVVVRQGAFVYFNILNVFVIRIQHFTVTKSSHLNFSIVITNVFAVVNSTLRKIVVCRSRIIAIIVNIKGFSLICYNFSNSRVAHINIIAVRY